ncbi:MAG: UvrB/UvrC motif-containing protein [Verrucomicrobia bacterium]|nr:UvrB/UvrC motif-containing protein [Verrucomicrobiota bacterium]
MLCSACQKKEATVFLTEIVGDKTHKVDLCEACSKEKGASDPGAFALADLLHGLGASQEISPPGSEDLKCPNCGFTQADFKKSGRLGCSECYTTFAEGLEGLLKTMHRGTRHTGKMPQALMQTRALADKLKSLNKSLEKAIAEEDFERAAKLRDEIRQMNAKLKEVTV